MVDLIYQRKEGSDMEYFLETSGSIESGHGFSHFDLLHLGWLGFFAVLIAVGCIWYRRLDESGRRKARYLMAGMIVANEIFKMVCLTIGNNYTVHYLPLHLCSINIFIVAIHAVRPNKVLDNFLYAICIPAALAALLFPSWTKLPFLNFSHIHSFTIHIELALYPVILTAAGDIRPDWRKIPQCLALLGGFGIVALIVNLLLDTNYMFLMEAESGNPLLYFEEWFGSHLIGFPVLITLILLIIYLPHVLLHRRKKKA